MQSPDIEFEWDDEKASRNFKKHGIRFELAETVFDDPYARVMEDPDHSNDETRAIIIGYAATNQLLFVAYAARDERIRLISARRATHEERKTYEQAND